MQPNPLYKIVVLGDGGVGKTALIIQLCLNHFLETYDPTIEDSYRKDVKLDNEICALEILDTAGQEEYTALRDQWIRDGQGFLLVYSVTSRSSFTRVQKFHSQIMRVKGLDENGAIGGTGKEPAVPIVIVGNKTDRITEREVTTQEGHALARSLKCQFRETSAKNNLGVADPFMDAARKIRDMGSTSVSPVTPSWSNGARGRSFQEKPAGKRSKCVVL